MLAKARGFPTICVMEKVLSNCLSVDVEVKTGCVD